MKKFTKIATLVLSIALLLTAFVIVIGAEEADPDAVATITVGETTTSYSNEAEAFKALANAASGAKMILEKDVTLTTDSVFKPLYVKTINLNGHTLILGEKTYIGSGRTLNIVGNGMIEVSKDYADNCFDFAGTLNFKGTNKITMDVPDTLTAAFMSGTGTLSIENAEINSSSAKNIIYAAAASKVNLTNVKMSAVATAITNKTTNTFVIKDSEFTLNENASFMDLYSGTILELANTKMNVAGTALTLASTSTANIKNSEITSTASENVIIVNSGATLDLAGVKITATVGTDNAKAAINIAGAPESIDLNYCSINTTKMPAFYASSEINPGLTINNSKIIVGESTFFGSWNKLTGEVNVNNSYVEYNSKICTSNSNYVFTDSTIALNAQGEVVRNGNLEIRGKTIIKSTVEKYVKPSLNDSKKVVLEAGTRFDKFAYQEWKSLDCFNATSEKYEFNIIYDTSNLEAPYLVVSKDVTAPPVPDGFQFANHSKLNFFGGNMNGGNNGATFNSASGTYEELSTNGKDYWSYTSALTSETAGSTYFYYGNTQESATASKVYVFDFDISAKEGTDYVVGNLSVNARSSSNRTTPFAHIAKDGSVKLLGAESVATGKINAGEWNHITAVVDTTKTLGTIYVYVNGTYIGSTNAVNATSDETDLTSVNFYGVRFDFDKEAYASGATMMMSGLDVRTYSTGGNFDDFGASYLLNNGLTYYKEYDDTAKNITIAGVSVPDINEALTANTDLGLKVELIGDVTAPQKANVSGFIVSNGYTLNTGYGSMPVSLADGVYEFHTRIEGIKANVAVYSDFGINIYIPEKYTITSINVNNNYGTHDAEMNGEKYTKIAVFKNSYSAAESIEITFNLSYNGYDFGEKTITINVVSYAKTVLNSYAASTKEAKLMHYMLGYAKASTVYFGKGDSTEIDTLLSGVTLDAYNGTYESEVISADSRNEAQKAAIEGMSARIDLDASNLAFIFEGCKDGTTATMNGVTYKAENGTITIKGLKVYNFDEKITLNIGGVEVNYNLATLISAYSAEQQNAKDLSMAFYNYTKAASEYKTETSQTDYNVTKLNILSGKQAIYSNNIKYIAGTSTSIALGDNEIFSISDNGMKLCNATVKGDYDPGNYSLKAYIAPEQNIMYVEVELPDGGIVRRGNSETLGSNLIQVFSENEDIGKGSVTYSDISKNSYDLVSTEPVNVGLESKFYNLVTSFDDACTTRYFAWTANASYIGTSEMALEYRESGTNIWYSVDAQRQEEASTVDDEDYFKAELTGLSPETVYEYRIGVKNSENDWGITHKFETAPESVSDFKFVAIGDTQSFYWDGDTVSTKGYKYAMAAIEEAVQDAGNPAFILHTGDITDTSSRLAEWNWYFKALGSYAASIPHFAAIGNHDIRTNDQNNYFSLHLNHPDNGKNAMDEDIANDVTGAYGKVMVSSYDDTIYSYDYGNAHFIVLNSGVDDINDDKCIYNAQREWLEDDLKANADADWIIVMTHDAVYNQASGTNNRQYLSDIIEEYGVDLVIQGHSHLVTRTYPMKNGQIVTKANADTITKGSGTVYTTIGSTTLSHDAISDPNAEECLTAITPHSNQPTYAVVSVEGNELIVTVKQINGYVLDSFSIISEE